MVRLFFIIKLIFCCVASQNNVFNSISKSNRLYYSRNRSQFFKRINDFYLIYFPIFQQIYLINNANWIILNIDVMVWVLSFIFARFIISQLLHEESFQKVSIISFHLLLLHFQRYFLLVNLREFIDLILNNLGSWLLLNGLVLINLS